MSHPYATTATGDVDGTADQKAVPSQTPPNTTGCNPHAPLHADDSNNDINGNDGAAARRDAPAEKIVVGGKDLHAAAAAAGGEVEEDEVEDRSFSRSGTVVSRTDDVSSSSSSAVTSYTSSAATSDFSSRSPSHGSSSSAASSSRSSRSASSLSPRDAASGAKAEGKSAPAGAQHQHQQYHSHRHTHREERPRRYPRHPIDNTRSDPADLAYGSTAGSRLHRLQRAEEPEGYMGSSDTSSPHHAGRVQTSELTRFTRVLAAGRSTAQPHPLHSRRSHSGHSSGVETPVAASEDMTAAAFSSEQTQEDQQQQQQRWWRRRGDGPATPTQPSDRSLTASLTSAPATAAVAMAAAAHPYRAYTPTEGVEGLPSFSPSPVRRQLDSGDDTSVMSTGAGTGGAMPSMPNPHTQRPASSVSPMATVAAVPPSNAAAAAAAVAAAPLPPTHPRRSLSAQSRASSSPFSGGALHRTSPLHPNSSHKSSRTGNVLPSPTSRHASHSVGGTPNYPTVLRRSSSFTAGVLPPAGGSWAVAEGECAHPYLISAAPPLSAMGNTAAGSAVAGVGGSHNVRVVPLSERVHERTSSVASSVHSASSSARPSVPLPPSHVGPGSNMMAAVWVDLPVSQPGSRCATPVNTTNNNNNGGGGGGGGDANAQQQHRRRRTTPRRNSEPPSPATSTLAASVASSLDGGGYASSSAAAAALASVRLHYVTVGTQTENAEGVNEVNVGATGPLADTSRVLSPGGGAVDAFPADAASEGCHTPEKQTLAPEREDGEGEASGTLAPASAAIALPATAASVSSTSAEVSPRSLRVSTADPTFDETLLATAERPPPSRSGRQPALTEVPSLTGAAGATERGTTTQHQHQHQQQHETATSAYGVDVPTLPQIDPSCGVEVPLGAAQASITADGAAVPTGLMVSPVTPELPTLRCADSAGNAATTTAAHEATPKVEGASPAAAAAAVVGEMEMQQASVLNAPDRGATPALAVGGEESASTTLAAAPEASLATNTSESVAVAAQADEVQRLKMELAQMRTQYAQVLQQLNRMHQVSGGNNSSSGGGGGSAKAASSGAELRASRADDVEDVSAVSRSPSSSSSSSSSSSTFSSSSSTTALSATSPATPPPATTATASTDADAATTLQHVRAALERAKQRTNL